MGESSETEVRVVFAGGPQTGKSNLIKVAQKGNFSSDRHPCVLPNTSFDRDISKYSVPVVALDTSLEEKKDMKVKLKQADVVVLTYACDQLHTFDLLVKKWLPKLQKPQYKKVRVVVVGCKLDLEREANLWEYFHITCKLLMDRFPNVEATLLGNSAF